MMYKNTIVYVNTIIITWQLYILTGDPLHSRAACTQPCYVNTHSRAHCSPEARLCEQWGHGCVNNGARLCASARLCRGSPVILFAPNRETPCSASTKHVKIQTDLVIICHITASWIAARYGSGGRFKNTYELLNLRALTFSPMNKIHIFQCMGKIFCVEFQRYTLKFHTKYFTHTLKLLDLSAHMHFWNPPRSS